MRLRQQNSKTEIQTGSLLVALPTLLDSNFRRSILFLSHHDPEEGSVGFILNRPQEVCLGDLTNTSEGSQEIPVYEGGPVEQKSLIVARIHWHGDVEGVRFQSLGEEDLPSSSESSSGHDEIRAFTGYAGWSGGQLERELVEKSWVILPPTADLLLPVKTQEEGSARWRAIMKRLGPMYHLMAQAPDELGLN